MCPPSGFFIYHSVAGNIRATTVGPLGPFPKDLSRRYKECIGPNLYVILPNIFLNIEGNVRRMVL